MDRPQRGNQGEGRQERGPRQLPVKALAAHDQDGNSGGDERIGGEKHSRRAVERLRGALDFSSDSLIEVGRKRRDGGGHRSPQQTIHCGLARVHFRGVGISHWNILSLSAWRREAGGRDAGTI